MAARFPVRNGGLGDTKPAGGSFTVPVHALKDGFDRMHSRSNSCSVNIVKVMAREMTANSAGGYFHAMGKLKPISPDGEAIGERLEKLRGLTPMNQKAFAAHIGVAPNTYNQWERGIQPPQLPFGIALCAVLGITLDYLYLGQMHGLPEATYARLTGLRQVPAASPVFEHPDLPATKARKLTKSAA